MRELTMKTSSLAVVLIVSAVCLGGCVVVVKEETRGPKRPPVCLPTERTIAEIDAVSKLAFDLDRQRGYKRIAARAGISPDAQVYLVKTVFAKLAFEDAKEDVLLTLIGNPSFSDAAEQAVLEKLDRLAFEDSKQRILKAISERKA
ncbi:MAG: hypothetical protein AMJ75_05440 [Phycisphaerae bacterium SM1_79]|nr:MAG: hypothetical protein AMJ75_05440 [Phycisphaerae bacterium SM1_79]